MKNQLFDLTKKVSLITGGNGGIGLGMAKGLASYGSDIAIIGRNIEKNSKAKEELVQYGVKVETYSIDVSNEKDVKETVANIVNDFGRIDTVFANAGMNLFGGSFEDMDTDVYRKVLAVNLDGVFFTLRESCKHMVERAKNGDPGGSLVGVASLAGIEGAAKTQPYSASKGGVVGMTLPMARDLAQNGVRVVTIAPGLFSTPMLRSLPEDVQDALGKSVPFPPRLGTPSEFAQLSVQIVENCMLNGETIRLDGAIRMAPK